MECGQSFGCAVRASNYAPCGNISLMKLISAICAIAGLFLAQVAYAACDVRLFKAFQDSQATLVADCGTVDVIKRLNWKRAGSSVPVATVDLEATPQPAGTPAYVTVSVPAGLSMFSADGESLTGAMAAGRKAVFVSANPELSVAVTSGGSVSSNPAGISNCTLANGAGCVGTFAQGTNVVLTAAADEAGGYRFSNWGGACNGAGLTCSVSMTSAKAVSAQFVPIAVDGRCGGASGVLTPTPPVVSLCSVGNAGTVSEAGSAYSWSCQGLNGGNASSCSAPRSYTINASGSSGGAISPASATVAYGAAASFTVTPSAGYSATVSGCSGTLIGSTYTTGPITGSCSVSATFTANIVNGQCGGAHNTSVTSAPQFNLCSSGTSSTVAGTGPWTWTCSGANGGASASCSASLSVIDHYYLNILNRAGDSGGIDYWRSEVARMTALGANPKETYIAMARYFFTSAEFLGRNLDDDGFVRNLYLTFFNRAPDQGGLDYWKGQIAAGLPRDMVMYNFMFSSEFSDFMTQNTGASTQRAEVGVVIDFYRGAFGRLPDDGGMRYWVNQFRTAQCSSDPTGNVYQAAIDIAGGFMGGQDYWANPSAITNVKYVSDLYNAFMRRSADLEGFTYWVGALAANNPGHTAMRKSFIDTPEFAARVQAIVAQGCTTQM